MSATEIARQARLLAVQHRQWPTAITAREIAELCDALSGLAIVTVQLAGRIEELEGRPKAGRPPGSPNKR